jgi:hypothetical protein
MRGDIIPVKGPMVANSSAKETRSPKVNGMYINYK